MAIYEVYFRCDDCKREHPVHVRINLDDGPDHKESIAEFFRNSTLPPQVSGIQGHRAFCLKTGRPCKLENDNQILLVPRDG